MKSNIYKIYTRKLDQWEWWPRTSHRRDELNQFYLFTALQVTVSDWGFACGYTLPSSTR